MHDMQVLPREQLGLERRDALVELARAQASAENEQHKRIVGYPEHPAAFLARRKQHLLAHRVARHVHLRGGRNGNALPRALVSQTHRTCLLGELLVRKAHDGVLLVDDHGDAHLLGRTGDRNGDVPAEANDRARLDLGEPTLGFLRRVRDEFERLHEREGVLAVEAGCLEGLKRDARFRHKARLYSARRASEAHLHPPFFKHLCERKRRIDMTSGSPTRQYDEHTTTSFEKTTALQPSEIPCDSMRPSAHGRHRRTAPAWTCEPPSGQRPAGFRLRRLPRA